MLTSPQAQLQFLSKMKKISEYNAFLGFFATFMSSNMACNDIHELVNLLLQRVYIKDGPPMAYDCPFHVYNVN